MSKGRKESQTKPRYQAQPKQRENISQHKSYICHEEELEYSKAANMNSPPGPSFLVGNSRNCCHYYVP